MSGNESSVTWDDERDDFDVLGDLQSNLPGLNITSGYRTPEYQEDMRRRGYKPAKNSAHLTGDAIDIAAFPGMSLGEGAQFLANKYPNAKILYGDDNHKDHVHFSMPGYGKFPAFGQAKAVLDESPEANEVVWDDEASLLGGEPEANEVVWDDEASLLGGEPEANVEATTPEMETVVRNGFDSKEEGPKVPQRVLNYYNSGIRDPKISLEEVAFNMRRMAQEDGVTLMGEPFDMQAAQAIRERVLKGLPVGNEIGVENFTRTMPLPRNDMIDPTAGDVTAMLEEGMAQSAGLLNPIKDFFDVDLHGGVNKAMLRERAPDASEEEIEAMYDAMLGANRRAEIEGAAFDVDSRDTNPITRFALNTLGSLSAADTVGFGRGTTALARIAQNTGANAAYDFAVQASDIGYGAQDDYRGEQMAVAVLGGAGFSALTELGAGALGKILRKGANAKGSYIDIELKDGGKKRIYRGNEKPEDITPEQTNAETSEAFDGGEIPSFLKNPVKAKGKGTKKAEPKPLEDSGRGQSLSNTELRVNQLTERWENSPEFLIVNNVDDLDDKLASEITADNAEGSLGVTMPDGRVLLMTDNINTPEALDAVVFHEALGHVGLNTEYGKGLDDLLLRMDEGNETLSAETDAWIEKHPGEYGGNRARAVEEVLAELSEKGVIPKTIMDQIRIFMSKMGRKLGVKSKGYFGDAEVRAILRQGHERIINGEGGVGTIPGTRYIRAYHASSNDFDEFSDDYLLTGEGAMAFSAGHYSGTSDPTRKKYINDAQTRNSWGEKPYEMSERGQPIVGPKGQDFTDALAKKKVKPAGGYSPFDLGPISDFGRPKLFNDEELAWWRNQEFSNREEALDARRKYREEYLDDKLTSLGRERELNKERYGADAYKYNKVLFDESDRLHKGFTELRKMARTDTWNELPVDVRARVYELELPDEDWLLYEQPMSRQPEVVIEAFDELYRNDPALRNLRNERRLLKDELVSVDEDIDSLELRLSETDEELDPTSYQMIENDLEELQRIKQEVYEEYYELEQGFEVEPLHDGSTSVKNVKGRFVGADVYAEAANLFFDGDELALSKYLNKKGVPGTALYDGVSRDGKGEPSFNFVSYNPKEMKIVNKHFVTKDDPLTPETDLREDSRFVDETAGNRYMRDTNRTPSKLRPGRQKRRGMAGNVNLQRVKSKRNIEPALRDLAENAPEMTPTTFKAVAEKSREYDMDTNEIREYANQFDDADAIVFSIRTALVREAETMSRLRDKVLNNEATDNEMANFAAAVTRANDIFASVSKLGNMSGRLLGQQKIAAQSSSNVDLRFMAGVLKNTPMETPDGIRQVAQAMKDNPGKEGRVARDALKPAIEDYLNTTRYNAMLSHPATHVVNMLGTGSHFTADLSSKGLGAIIGAVVGGKDRISFGELAARMNGAIQAATALSTYSNTLKSFVDGVPQHRVSKIEHKTNTIKNPYASMVFESPTRLLAAEDEWWRNLVLLSSYYGEAHRIARAEGLRGKALTARKKELINNPTDEMLEAGNQYAEVIQFLDDPILSRIVDIEKARTRKVGDSVAVRAGRFLLRQIVPFVRTLDALMRAAVRYSPVGIASESTRSMLKAGGAKRHEAVGRLLIGQAMLFSSLGLLSAGRLTGDGPENYEKRREMESMVDSEGRPLWQANSVKIGDTWYSYRGMEPFSMVLNTIANSYEAMERGEDGASLAPTVVKSIISSMNDNTFTAGIGDFFAALQGGPMGENAWNNYIAGYASSYVPGIFNYVNEDPMVKETSGDGTLGDRVAGRMAGRAGLEGLPQRYDVYGRKMERPTDPFFSLTRFRSPNQGEVSPGMIELSRLASQLGPEKALISREDRGSLQKLPGPVDIGTVQEYQREVGILTVLEVEDRIENDLEWEILTDAERVDEVKKIITSSRKTAKETLFPEYYGDSSVEERFEDVEWDD